MELIIVKAAPAGVYIAFSIALYIWHVATSILGVFIADYFNISDFNPDIKNDLKKMSICSFIALSIFLSALYIAQHPWIFPIYVLLFFFSLKIAYLDSNQGFLFTILGINMAGMVGFISIVKWINLKGMFFLYLIFFIAFLILYQKNQRIVKENKEIERIREHNIRNIVKLNPNFTTFCYQCVFYSQDIKRCQLKIDGKEVNEIIINQRTYCTSFKQNPTNNLRTKY